MPTSPKGFEQRIARLRADMVDQGRRVERMVEASVEAIFEKDEEKASWVVGRDQVIDRADVEIERAAVSILTDLAKAAVDLPARQVRRLLMIVKVNNELERAADGAVDIAEQVHMFRELSTEPSNRFRVMCNSAVGILRDTVRCFELEDTALAQGVLASDDTMDEFERAILREMQQGVAEGVIGYQLAFATNMVANDLERIADHCTNIAEQVIYIATGKIVRHSAGHWTAPEEPPI